MIRRLIDAWCNLRDHLAVLKNAPSPAARAWYAEQAGDLRALRHAEADARAAAWLIERSRMESMQL
jgi:hypothetical protein